MDLAILPFLAAPFVASLILTGIHAYLGVHVEERGVNELYWPTRDDRPIRHIQGIRITIPASYVDAIC